MFRSWKSQVGKAIANPLKASSYFIDKATLCETEEDITDETKIDRFAFKLFEYLWDDVAKYAHSDWFSSDIKTLDALIDNYKKLGAKVFADGVLDL